MAKVQIQLPRLEHNKAMIMLKLDGNKTPFDLNNLIVDTGEENPKTIDNLIKEVKPQKKIKLKKISSLSGEENKIKTEEVDETFVFESMADFDYSSLCDADVESRNNFFKEQLATVNCLKEIALGMNNSKFITDLQEGKLEKFLNNLK